MTKHAFPLAALVVLAAGVAFAGSETTEAVDGVSVDTACRLQDNGQCLKALETRASAVAKRHGDREELFAVLVNGDTSSLHNRNVERAYEVLRTLGTPDENIYILSNSNPRPAGSDESSMVTARPSTRNLDNVLYYLSGEVGEDDCVVLYTTGHGDRRRGQSVLCLNDGLVYEKDLVKNLKQIRPGAMAVVMDQCFSGGFADAFQQADLDVLAMTDTDGDNETYCEYFAAAFWFGLLEPAADIDSDGRISFAESYEVAMEIHRLALADTPERTRGQLLAGEQCLVPAVSVAESTVVWTAEEAETVLEEPIIEASAKRMKTRLGPTWEERYRPNHRSH